MQDDAHWQRLIDGLRAGDDTVIGEFVGEYGRSLEAVADKHIATQMHRRFGPDDVAQSVCRTFLRRVEGGEFELEGSEALWRLLCAITLTKVREKARHHLRKKRSISEEKNASTDDGEGPAEWQVPHADPTPSMQVEFADTFQHLLASLDAEDRQLVDLKLQQQSNEQIAETMACSERTVRRMLARLQSRFEEILNEDNQ